MRKANALDEKLVTHIIAASFDDNPSVNSVVKQDGKRKKRINALARYAFKTALRRNGVYISSDEQGVAICYRSSDYKEGIADYLDQLMLVNNAIGWGRVLSVLKREAYLKKVRKEASDYLYFWFFGVTKEGRGRGAARELKEAIFDASESLQLPIYLETSVVQNKIVYERFGFKVYHTWENYNGNGTLWFMRRECT